jgi:hypothetical protein
MMRSLGWRVLVVVLAGTAMHAEGRAEPRAVEVAFTSAKHQIVVRVKLGKQGPFAMLLDTGTDLSVIDAALARRLRALHEGEAAGVGTMRDFERAFHDLRLGGLRADSVPAMALDLGKLSEKIGTHIDGVLGYSFLEGRIVQIDYRRRRLRFCRDMPSWSGSESVEVEMALAPDDPTPRFAGRINRRNAQLLYDSGSSHPVAVAGRAIEPLGLKAAFEAARPESAFGDGGRVDTRTGRVPTVEIGTFRFVETPCVFGVPGSGESWERGPAAGKIGGALLEKMVVTLDYPGRHIRFER